MRFRQVLFVATVLFIFACGQKKQNKVETREVGKISDVFNSYWEKRSQLFPLDATQQGDNRFNHILQNDQTQGFRDTLRQFYQSYLSRLDSFKREDLNANDRLSYDIFKYEMGIQLEGLKTNLWMIPTQQFWGLPLTMGQLGSGDSFQPFKTPQDYKNWLGRVKSFSTWTDSAIANFRKGVRAGVVLPKPLVKKMIPQMEAMVVSDPERSLFYQPIKNMPGSFSEQEKSELRDAYKEAISRELVPSYKKLRDFLQKEYYPAARTSAGISAIPQGKENYMYLVKYWTTTSKSPDEIYQTGLDEVKRIRDEMESVKKEANFVGDLKSFFEYMRKEPRFMPFKTPQDVLNAFRGIQQHIEPNLNRLFGNKPKTPFEIRQTEAFRAASASAEYMQGSPDGSRPGIFYIPIVDAEKFNITSGMESLFLHEAIPGHHYQISLQQENTDLPKFRRFAWYGAYGEGWALYSESLGKELGVYSDPYQYMGALGDEMHRAVRLVVDVGIHMKGMTREQAIKYMMENEAISEEGAVAEVERYMAVPGQALSYKIGALKIRELRNRYAQKAGRKFKLTDFHDEFLKDGCMPLQVVEEKMNTVFLK
ncbi:DUF885 domain-containing protein [Desertivirga brevis]|uniref:DUF885 domain-containing protein n=1 Tax=Desertivirga brevis TaxID=2810310 RepID=UPI001A96375A|nr:DUF885 domain-containing protein [Pedobacter sp. SYSU D00873]